MTTRSLSIVDHFATLEDPRVDRTKLHLLDDILVLTISAVICGADTFVGIEQFGHAKHDWLSRLLKLPNGIPSHATIGKVLARLDPVVFGPGRSRPECFLNWIQAVCAVHGAPNVPRARLSPSMVSIFATVRRVPALTTGPRTRLRSRWLGRGRRRTP
jgi:hypothetical protein